jgi:hypothetical protein
MLAQAETATVITPSVTQETSDLASILMVSIVPLLCLGGHPHVKLVAARGGTHLESVHEVLRACLMLESPRATP